MKDTRLIEDLLPIREISRESVRERFITKIFSPLFLW